MADSEITRQDMIIRNMVSKSFNYVPYFHKKFWPEISTIIEISIDFDSHTIIEYQIFHVILPILQDNLAKILENVDYVTIIENIPLNYHLLNSHLVRVYLAHHPCRYTILGSPLELDPRQYHHFHLSEALA